jgi:hypothetical protein
MAEEEKKEEEAAPDWLADAISEAAEKTKEAPSMTPPQVNQRENDFLNISEEEKEARFNRGNAIIIAIIIVQIIALGFVIWWP